MLTFVWIDSDLVRNPLSVSLAISKLINLIQRVVLENGWHMRWELWTVSDGVIATVLHKLNPFPQPMTQDPQQLYSRKWSCLKNAHAIFLKTFTCKRSLVSASVKNPIPKDLCASPANPTVVGLYSCKMGLSYRGNEWHEQVDWLVCKKIEVMYLNVSILFQSTWLT